MAKVYDLPIDKATDWGGDASTGNLPVKGNRVQDFIKETLENKAGCFYYDETNNRYLVFADTTNRDAYLADTTKTNLIIATFDAPFNYSAIINLTSSTYNAVFTGSIGNYIRFTFDTQNKNGQSVGEDVIATYTIIRNSTKKIITEKYRYGESVEFCVDDYLLEGTNTIVVGIMGQNTLAATTVGITYQVVTLSLSDTLDISKVYDLSEGNATLEIPFSVSGYGIKEMEWYIDGEKLDYIKVEDEIVESSISRTKYITLSSLSQGAHSLQFRVYTTVNGEKFYSDTLYRDLIVYTGANTNPIVATKFKIPQIYGVLNAGEHNIYELEQYVLYALNFALYNPLNPVSTEVSISLADEVVGSVAAVNGEVNEYSLTPKTVGNLTLKLTAGTTEYSLTLAVSATTMDISEITNALMIDFQAVGKSNSSTDKDVWSYGDYVGTFQNFLWTETSGWVNSSLFIASGNVFSINFAPLMASPVANGRTIEFAFKTTHVLNDDTVILDLMDDAGVGLKITAAEAILTSKAGKSVSTKFKSEEDVRIAFVINKTIGVTNKCMAFIYVNGIASGAVSFAATDDFGNTKALSFVGSNNAEIELSQIRVYDTALSQDQILNNYILYQKTISAMQTIYYRNDIYEEGSSSLSMEKLERTLPVMLVTGSIPTLEATTDKNLQIVVNIDYYNLQDPTKAFTMTGAAMRPQGTSSMSYPKKNFRIYTQKLDTTKVYDYLGNEIVDKLYSFKDGAQPVNIWCLKADYAESSSTHNTGIARLWNQVLYDAQISGEYKLRTAAQVAALANSYEYDVRTTVDGFPILMFYRPDADSDVVFMGKYNFNNDKSSESVFGFKDIPGFDNTNMQCWEVLNNGNHLALFTDVENWDTEWSDAFEARYPDKATDTTALKTFAEWLVGVKNTPATFATEKWAHMDVYKMAAYYVYLMRFGAVDQVVKNAMFTTEDGVHWFYINYDNDTINGVRNDGLPAYGPEIDRQSLDATYVTEVYAYAGHDSVLWNMLEADSEFMSLVSTVDNALYSAGLTYAKVIEMFNVKQSAKWCERVYNRDAQYKYIGPFTDSAIDNLYMLQGSREAHRKWWLSKRFSLLDSKFVSGGYKSHTFEIKVASAPIGINFSIKSGGKLYYGYGVNNEVAESGILLEDDATHTFTTAMVLNIGDPLRIYAASNLKEIDISAFITYLSTVNASYVYDEVLGTKLEKLIMGDGMNENTSLASIQGLSSAKRLKVLDIRGYRGITALDLSFANYLEELDADDSGLTSVDFAEGSYALTTVGFSDALQHLNLVDLPNLTHAGISFQGGMALQSININKCPNVTNDFAFAIMLIMSTKSTLNSVYIDNIDWTCSPEDLITMVTDLPNYTFKGKITLTSVTQEQVDNLIEIFGTDCFNKTKDFYITAPDSMFLSGPTEVLEGENAQYTCVIFSTSTPGDPVYQILTGTRPGTSIDSATGLLTTIENGINDTAMTIKVHSISSEGVLSSTTLDITIKKRIYPTSLSIAGTDRIDDAETYTPIVSASEPVTGNYVVNWELTGDLVTQSVASITEQDNSHCVITKLASVTEQVSGTLTCTIKKVVDDSVVLTSTKIVYYFNENIAVSASNNPNFMKALYAAGLSVHDTYMTKTEAAAVTSDDIYSSNGDIFVKYLTSEERNAITSLNEFKYFTGVTTFNLTYALQHVISIDLSNVQILGANVFSYGHLQTVIFSSALTEMGKSAFTGCYLTTLDLSSCVNLVHIGYQCFYASHIESVILPTKDINLDESIFYDCKSLSSIDLSYITNIPDSCFDGCTSLASVTFSNNLISIGRSAFGQCNISSLDLSTVTSLVSIGSAAFMSNPLLSVKLPSTLEVLSGDAFSECYTISLTIEQGGIYSIKNGAIYKNSDTIITLLPNFTVVDEGAITLGDSSGYYCCCLKQGGGTDVLDLSGFSSLTKIGCYMFRNLHGYSSVVLPSSIIQLGAAAFQSSSITSITFPSALVSIGESCFTGSHLVSVDLSGHTSLVNIYDEAFRSCTFLQTVDLSGTSVTDLGKPESWQDGGSFEDCTALSSIILPTGLTRIRQVCFRYTNLAEITIPSSVTRIDNAVFRGCLALATINCLSTVAPTKDFDFGVDSSSWTGYTTASAGTNRLYVPAGATGYDSGYWLDPLCDAAKCGFTLSATL